MSENLVSFKGSKEGVYIYVKEGDFEIIKEELDHKLKRSGEFFKSGKVINFKGKKLSIIEKEELKKIINNKYGIAVDEKKSEDGCKDISKEASRRKTSYFDGIEEGKTKFIRATVRSGQSIEYSGNIIIIGDVNAGGVVIAKGNIVVLGTLRGIAHAGSDGNREAIVTAFNLQPTQLRIADIIARPPDEDVNLSRWPEIAKIKDNMVIIEPYLPKK